MGLPDKTLTSIEPSFPPKHFTLVLDFKTASGAVCPKTETEQNTENIKHATVIKSLK